MVSSVIEHVHEIETEVSFDGRFAALPSRQQTAVMYYFIFNDCRLIEDWIGILGIASATHSAKSEQQSNRRRKTLQYIPL